MNINRNNYAEFFVDYFDGNLSAENCTVLFSFLEQNPDLKEEFNAFELHNLFPDTIIYEDKSELKKPSINITNYQTYLVAGIENDLDEAGKNQLNTFIEKNPYVQFEEALFDKTKLAPGTELFKNKQSLKRPVIIPFYVKYKYQMAVAAAVALLLLFSQVFFNPNQTLQQFTADKTETFNETESIAKLETEVHAPLADNNSVAKTAMANNTYTDLSATAEQHNVTKARLKNVKQVELATTNYETNLKYIDVEAIAFTIADKPKESENNNQYYATIINEVENPETSGQLSQITDNTIKKISNDALSLNSKRTKSGLLKSWKLQAGNFSIKHTKN